MKDLERRNEKVKGYRDMRKLFEDKFIDIITIATPNHWHSPHVWAVRSRQGCLRREARFAQRVRKAVNW